MANEKQLRILNTGAAIWNQWRRENSDIKVNLKGAELQGVSLQGVNLSQADLRQVSLKGVNLRWANLHGANLSEVNLSQADLREANLGQTNLTGAKYNEQTLWPKDFDPTTTGAIRVDE